MTQYILSHIFYIYVIYCYMRVMIGYDTGKLSITAQYVIYAQTPVT